MGILLVHKIHDARFRLFLFKWIAALVLLLGAGLRGFNLMPLFPTVVLFSVTIALCAFFFWLGSEDLFLIFALEDEEFYNLATQSRALSVFNDTDSPKPQSSKKGSVRKGAMSLRNFESALTPQEGLRTVDIELFSIGTTNNHSQSSTRHPNRRHPTINLTNQK